MNIITAIENDLTAAWTTVEHDAEKFGAILWGDVKPLLLAVEPQVYADLRAVVLGVLTAFGKGGSLSDIETALLNVLEAGGTALLGTAQGLGSNVLQLVIGLVKSTIPAPAVP